MTKKKKQELEQMTPEELERYKTKQREKMKNQIPLILMYNETNWEVSDVFSTYAYRMGIEGSKQKKDEPAPEQKTEEKTEQKTEEKTDEPTTPPEPAIPQWQIDHPGWLCEDKVTLTVATYEDSATGYVKPGDDVCFRQWLEDYTNVHIDWTIWDYTDWKTNSNTMIATGEITDIFRTGGTDICDTCGENGLALDLLPYLLDGCFDKTLAAMENKGMSRTEYLSKFTNSLKGKMYGYNCYTGTQHYNRQCLFCNAHILEQLEGEFEYGIDKTPKSVEEFYEYCKKIKALGDYNGNGNVFYEDGTGNGYATIVSSKCANPEIACRWLDTLCCDETVNVARWLGFEGEQWEYDKDGNRVILPGGSDSTVRKEMGLGQITLPHLQSTNGDGLVNTELDWFMHEQNELLEKAEYRLLTSVSTAWYTSDEKAMTNKYSGDFTAPAKGAFLWSAFRSACEMLRKGPPFRKAPFHVALQQPQPFPQLLQPQSLPLPPQMMKTMMSTMIHHQLLPNAQIPEEELDINETS